VVHRDLKPENVLVNTNVTNPFEAYAVLADFGLARDASITGDTGTFYVTTRQYRPPEVVTNLSLGHPSLDVWSLGCILYELVTGETLIHNQSARDDRGRWLPAKASLQLEHIMDVVGTPNLADVALMEESNVKSYLSKSRQRPSLLVSLLNSKFKLVVPEDERGLP